MVLHHFEIRMDQDLEALLLVEGEEDAVATRVLLESLYWSETSHLISQLKICNEPLVTLETFVMCIFREIIIPNNPKDLRLLNMLHQRWQERHGMKWIDFVSKIEYLK